MDGPDRDDVVFFTISTGNYFIGLVALINSIRLLGHRERIVVLDCGLDAEQIALIEGHCELVRPPPDVASSAAMYKAFGQGMNKGGVSIIIDSDMIVTANLTPVIAIAREGRITCCNDPEVERWFAEWTEIFGLQVQLRREQYINSGFVVFSDHHWPELLPRWWSLCQRIFSNRVLYHGDHSKDPTAQADQDALNALLMSEIVAGSVARLPANKVAHCSFQNATAKDVKTLACEREGTPTTILHWPGRPKPWEWSSVRDWRGWTKFSNVNPYILLLRRLLIADDIAIKLPMRMLPIRLRRSVAGKVSFNLIGICGRMVELVRTTVRARRTRG